MCFSPTHADHFSLWIPSLVPEGWRQSLWVFVCQKYQLHYIWYNLCPVFADGTGARVPPALVACAMPHSWSNQQSPLSLWVSAYGTGGMQWSVTILACPAQTGQHPFHQSSSLSLSWAWAVNQSLRRLSIFPTSCYKHAEVTSLPEFLTLFYSLTLALPFTPGLVFPDLSF